uniref:RING-type domain-containing protein n=1 Tax=viral metagenome TaxID=1070528 RepID=A0A6C0EJQ6_9ZZZZ
MTTYSTSIVRNLEHEFDLCVTKTTSTPISTSEDTSCPICMEDITDKDKTTTACGHVFHSSCIFKNMMLRTSCPMCREDLICKSIPSSTNTNINININYNLSQNHSLMDIDDDIINALLSEDLLFQDTLSQELQYVEPPINNNDDNETVNASDSDSDSESDADSDSESHQELDNISSNSSVSVYDSSFALPTLADPDDDDESDEFERFETDLTLSEVTNKMIELGYTPEDMFYYMTWRVNPFYFNMQYLNKYNDDFYNTMTETMHKIFSKEIPITSNSELPYNSLPMTIDELN